REGGAEFFQAGIEDLGEADIAAADARSMADAHALLTRLLPGKALAVTIGDQSVFEAVLAALGLPRGWQKRLARAFGSPGALEAALSDLTNPTRATALDEPAASLLLAGEPEPLATHIAERMEAAGHSLGAGRSPQEIAKRLIEKSELRSVRLSDEALSALKAFLDIRAPLGEAHAVLEAFASEAKLSLGSALTKFGARADAIASRGLAGTFEYDAAFGRPLDYYTGLVFEIGLPGDTRPLAGGGRYDRLLTLLGATAPIPGVGFSAWIDRIAEARP
ncbi:MAG: ATP phosphoribosyltransferase regulatory subunit, partial [Rhizobiaceae bacterium]|nr:ATP phosphoribosyltransferase regulatory subunit [Rhizobiaceae bacterium]